MKDLKIKHDGDRTGNKMAGKSAVKAGDFGSYEEGVKRTMKAAAVDGVPYAASVAKSVAPTIQGKTVGNKTKRESGGGVSRNK